MVTNVSNPKHLAMPRHSYLVLNENIAQFTTLPPVRLRNVTAIIAKYKNKKAYTQTAYGLAMTGHPLKDIAHKRWATRTDTFWWSSVANKITENKRVVRSWAARRMKIAFIEALTKEGFSADGSPIKGSGQQSPLYGTMQLIASTSILKANHEQLRTEADMILQHIIGEQTTGPWGSGPLIKSKKKQRGYQRGKQHPKDFLLPQKSKDKSNSI